MVKFTYVRLIDLEPLLEILKNHQRPNNPTIKLFSTQNMGNHHKNIFEPNSHPQIAHCAQTTQLTCKNTFIKGLRIVDHNTAITLTLQSNKHTRFYTLTNA